MIRSILTLMLAAPLAGCGLFFGENGGPDVAVRTHDNGTLDPRTAGEAAMAEGREAMRGGNLIAAMSAFRIAQRDPLTAADATNALGVAWTTLGRHDLAEKMFLEAIALAPRDRRFAANLERLLAERVVPGLQPTETAPLLARSAPPATQPVRSKTDSVRTKAPVNRLVRVSRTEVRIGTADRAPATENGAATVSAVSGPARGPAIRVARPRAGDRLYPRRVILPVASDRAERDEHSYPVRVSLPARTAASREGARAPARYPLRVALRPRPGVE